MRKTLSLLIALALVYSPLLAYANASTYSLLDKNEPQEVSQPARNNQLYLANYDVPRFQLAQNGETHINISESDLGQADGALSAQEKYCWWTWFGIGFGSGALLGLIGTGVAAGVGQILKAKPPAGEILSIKDKSPEFSNGYLKGYSREAKNKRLSSSLVGGLLGTAVTLTIVLSLGLYKTNND